MKKTLTVIGRAIAVAIIAVLLFPLLYHILDVLVLGNTFFVRGQRVHDCLENGRYKEALRHADRHVDKDGAWYGDAYYLRAVVHSRLGDFERALADLTVAIGPPSKGAGRSEITRRLVARGRCHEQKGMREAAVADYRAAYNRLVHDIDHFIGAVPGEQRNYMEIIHSFWAMRDRADTDFEFDHLQFQSSDSHREAKRLRLNAVLNWLREFVDVHPTIIANIDDVDAKVYRLDDEDAGGPDSSAIEVP